MRIISGGPWRGLLGLETEGRHLGLVHGHVDGLVGHRIHCGAPVFCPEPNVSSSLAVDAGSTRSGEGVSGVREAAT